MYSLLFELNSIQTYLFASGKLRDMIAGSELLDQLTNQNIKNNLLDSVLCAAEISQDIEFSRRAGGAFYAFCMDKTVLDKLLGLWTLAIQQWAPGLSYSLGRGQGGDYTTAFTSARKNLQADAGRLRQQLPFAAPVAHRVGRTGLAAEKYTRKKSEWLDASGVRRKVFSDLAKAEFWKRFSPESAQLRWHDWPTDLDSDNEDGRGHFPFNGDDHTIALIHADGNGLGQVLMEVQKAVKQAPDKFIEFYQGVSNMIEASTQAAARAATQEVLLPRRKEGQCLPARPLLLGGDDITILVRADLALAYIQVFSRAFEEESGKRLGELAIEGLPERLTLGFGVVFMRASQPFYMAINLCEQMMAEGKATAKQLDMQHPPATLVFQRVTTSLVDSYDQIRETRLSHKGKNTSYIDTLGTYAIEPHEQLPNMQHLLELAELLAHEDMAHGPTRQLLTLIGQSEDEARRRYRRWRRLMKENKSGLLKKYNDGLQKLISSSKNDLPYSQADAQGISCSPLADALALVSVAAVGTGTSRVVSDKGEQGE
ncbi:MAG: hypothetical protein KZQ58_08985 [gamma proteobacterium symbiont of Bathyaustriella thionipta]|nr:hypothetical protein [gamma proteobacterium symbiont of Bathyaustriella thionipta]